MLFNSFDFALFLPITFILYWFVFNKNLHLQNLFVILASYLFYGWWDWRFLSLIIFSSVVDYSVGLLLESSADEKRRKFLLFISLFVNLGLLGVFKYYNFFMHSFVNAFSQLGISAHPSSLKIILPVGISFYTFQTLSYSIDIYRKKLHATKDIFAFFAFVSFFPQLVAGPIERAVNLLPQFQKKRSFNTDLAKDGVKQILWGLFKKVVVADSCAYYVNRIFLNYDTMPANMLLIGIVFFAFQIYGDFSGYSDIAIGVARLFGFNLMRNFAFPYFSRDIAEFWRRWHISLSTWFRDYVYIPLGGSRTGRAKRIRNILITFTLSGLWHGANWTFIFWGFLNGLYYIPLMLQNKQKEHVSVTAENRILPTFNEFIHILSTFILTLFAWTFFRAESMTQAIHYSSNIFQASLFSAINPEIYPTLITIGILILTEWFQRDKQHGLQFVNVPQPLRALLYLTVMIAVMVFFGEGKTFIYFQF